MTTPDAYPLNEPVSVQLAPTPPGPALAQPAISGSIASGTSITLTLANPTKAGNCLIVAVGSFQSTSNPTVSGITLGGSAGNFAVAKQANGANQSDCEVWIDWNCAGGQTSVVITFAAGTGVSQGNTALVMEWSGLISSGTPVDKTNGANGTAASFSSGSSGTLSQANELVIGAVAQDLGSGAVITGPSSPWTNLAQVNSSNNSGLVASYLVVSSTAAQTYAGTFPGTAGFGTVIVTLKVAPSTGPTPGSGTARITPGYPGAPGSGVGASRNSGLLWNVSGVAVSVATNVAEAQASCYISYGIQSASPNDFQGQTQLGSTGDTCTVSDTLKPGDWITVVWKNGDPGAIATMRVFGTVTPPGVK